MSKREEIIVSKEEISRQKQFCQNIKLILENKKRPYYAFVETYGCAQNVNDGEKLQGMLLDMGYLLTEDKENADVIIYNTCAVRENAELKVFGNIGALKNLKRKNPDLIIGVCGCMIQQEHIVKKMKRSFPFVNLIFGTHALYRFPEILHNAFLGEKRVIDTEESDGRIAEEVPVYRDGSVCAGVSVMYGCNNFCTYCIVPYVRGRERSREVSNIIEEVKALSKSGVKEVTLLGQNVNSYGKDIEGGLDFADLLKEVAKVEGIERIRFMTSHPKDLSDKLIDTIATTPKVCKQLHLPIQCGSDNVLKSMNRKYTREEYLAKIKKVKEKIPGITLTTDIIVGFPTETNEDFEYTIDVLKEVRYDVIFSFIYSKRVGTPAAVMDDVITTEEKKRNFDRMLDVQNTISAEINKEYEGKVYPVLVEGVSKNNPKYLTGRTDGGKLVHFKGDESLKGQIINIKITTAHTWSLYGDMCE
ncbi:MAG: tRNA (N6-isopentenyl adenosine(37)-C2)-methylthiotransferase MiaB [Ruminococcaceae bacterium]|nr:tRNA (N6-isopentenyl adenosine(37)-C2)-methylthiotransferase MiaB [Oscillospiraceae bacterium]